MCMCVCVHQRRNANETEQACLLLPSAVVVNFLEYIGIHITHKINSQGISLKANKRIDAFNRKFAIKKNVHKKYRYQTGKRDQGEAVATTKQEKKNKNKTKMPRNCWFKSVRGAALLIFYLWFGNIFFFSRIFCSLFLSLSFSLSLFLCSPVMINVTVHCAGNYK